MRLFIESKRVVAIHFDTHPYWTDFLLLLVVEIDSSFDGFSSELPSTEKSLFDRMQNIVMPPDETLYRVETRRGNSFRYSPHPHPTTVVDGVSLIRRLQKYVHDGLLQPWTLFCTFDITNLYTMLPQKEALDILVAFLKYHGYEKVNGIPMEAIRELARIVLEENVFVCGNKFYRQTKGGAMGSSFTLTIGQHFHVGMGEETRSSTRNTEGDLWPVSFERNAFQCRLFSFVDLSMMPS